MRIKKLPYRHTGASDKIVNQNSTDIHTINCKQAQCTCHERNDPQPIFFLSSLHHVKDNILTV